ncbi:MAG: suppressor of fused domain protein [Spirochaetales bacterium]|nr:suppressor of fused domain protein [Spirochaetales bacterium]
MRLASSDRVTHVFPWRDDSILEILYSAASFHLHVQALGAPHTVNLGRSWTPSSLCTHAVIQQPYIDGIALEIFEAAGFHVHCYWLIPITEAEKDFALEHGYEALAELFERKALNYLDPNRASLV